MSSCALKAMPAMPMPLNGFAAISPATNVPWPSVSRSGDPPTNDRAATTRPGELGMADVDPGVDHRDLDRREVRRGRPEVPGVILVRYHCWAENGSVLSNAAAADTATRAASEDDHAGQPSHGSVTAGESPGCSPPPGAQRIRYRPDAIGPSNAKAPVPSVTVEETVVQPAPFARCS